MALRRAHTVRNTAESNHQLIRSRRSNSSARSTTQVVVPPSPWRIHQVAFQSLGPSDCAGDSGFQFPCLESPIPCEDVAHTLPLTLASLGSKLAPSEGWPVTPRQTMPSFAPSLATPTCAPWSCRNRSASIMTEPSGSAKFCPAPRTSSNSRVAKVVITPMESADSPYLPNTGYGKPHELFTSQHPFASHLWSICRTHP